MTLQVGQELHPSHDPLTSGLTYLQLPVFDLEEQDMVIHFHASFDFIKAGLASGERKGHVHVGELTHMVNQSCFLQRKPCLVWEAGLKAAVDNYNSSQNRHVTCIRHVTPPPLPRFPAYRYVVYVFPACISNEWNSGLQDVAWLLGPVCSQGTSMQPCMSRVHSFTL